MHVSKSGRRARITVNMYAVHPSHAIKSDTHRSPTESPRDQGHLGERQCYRWRILTLKSSFFLENDVIIELEHFISCHYYCSGFMALGVC